MNRVFLASVLAAISFPALSSDFSTGVFSPAFKTSGGNLDAGKAFVAAIEGCSEPVLVSALHLFGPSGGLETQLKATELAARVQEVELRSITSPSHGVYFKAESLTPAGANPCCGQDPMSGIGDIATFRAPESFARIALPVSPAATRKGDRVFVVTSLVGRNGPPFKFEAVVHGTQSGHLIYDYVDRGISIRATSGAPVVDQSGRVVAINLGGEQQASGRTVGIGNPTTNWLQAVRQTCNKSTKPRS